jgi:hypothetical protein
VATPNVIKMDNNQNTTLMEQFQNSNIKIAERGKIDSPSYPQRQLAMCCTFLIKQFVI